MIVLLAGASGLVGGHTLEFLLEDSSVTKIVALVRTSLKIKHEKLLEIKADLDHLEEIELRSFQLDHVDAALCALGTTIKKAGSQSEFKKVDCQFVLAIAAFARKYEAKKFAVVSALGADSRSAVFYNRTKGEMEEGLKKAAFETLTILRPSLLIGERKEKRPAEKFFIKISPVLNRTMIGPLKKYRGIEAKKVASHLARSIHTQERGHVIIENDQMLSI